MDNFNTHIKFLCAVLFCAVFFSCSKENVISKNSMAEIVEEMYLADQYIKLNPDLMAQADSMAVYSPIIAKHGYTVEEYENSLRYYLQRTREYQQILEMAKASIEAQVEVIDEIQRKELAKGRRDFVKWWALDSVKAVKHSEFLYDKLLRGVRWLVLSDEIREPWKMCDSAVVDIPQNAEWWKNNMVSKERNFVEYMVREPKKVEKPKRRQAPKFNNPVKK